MDDDDISIEDKCENMMNIVVESRKRFGKMCIDYEQKTLLMENQILNLQLETISNYRFKPKNVAPQIDAESMCSDLDDFAVEITERQKKIENLHKNLKNTQDVVLQLKGDKIGRKLREPLSAEVMLNVAKHKI